MRVTVASLFEHAVRMHCEDVSDLTIGVLRSWLARLHSQGASRATLARRASSARMFTAWAVRDGLLDVDPGALLASPKGRRPLPEVLRVDEAAAVMQAAGEDVSPRGLRNAAIVELLYATGARVSELCGLDIDDLDAGRHTVRLLGKGAKERTVPLGEPAARRGGLLAGPRAPADGHARTAARRCCSARGAAGSTHGRRDRSSTSGSRRSTGWPIWVHMGCVTPQRHTFWKAART